MLTIDDRQKCVRRPLKVDTNVQLRSSSVACGSFAVEA
jgi:hypothetical protein